jgi:hypothetical protein
MARNAIAVRIPRVSGRFFSSLMLPTLYGQDDFLAVGQNGGLSRWC